MWKQFVREYLGFSKKERRGILILLALIFLCFAAPFFYPYFIHHKQYDHRSSILILFIINNMITLGLMRILHG
jgi:hypothetical protein